jgi:hypothetical protein
MKLAIEKGKGAIQAYCRIASQAGIFVADAVSDSPIRAVQQIEQKIKDQKTFFKRAMGFLTFKTRGGRYDIRWCKSLL